MVRTGRFLPDVVTEALFPEWSDMYKTGEELKRDAMSRVAANAPQSWLSAAKHAGVVVARRRVEFTTDPIWKVLELQATPPPHEPRAMGAVMKALCEAGVCAKTDRVSMSVRPECHRRPITVYRSLIYGS